ncbi:methylcobalamin:coenzyme M methyltransferase [Anaerohalosphaera lusitana]|uniref:Methylcobalamin:coenzyme M methyltransferase n=1 Tax=Anaerohalosphaera lusitana TaxID=1936003 RepID=A0A1U9NN73_9BACT|nr:uroporphyrinogen decarboxylase family protein [Anaerohalosphaera lusitana]AQT69178.1 methylcobalamin:coenzyme M methyltransferase [Anaerohalosphaera lusitana]
MNARENLLSIFRRQGFDYVPSQFYLCPSLCEVFKQRTGSDLSYQDYFELPMREVEFPSVAAQQSIDWGRFYGQEFKNTVTFDEWGIAHESGSKAAAHMTRMHHPMASFDSLEQIQSYPYPDFAAADTTELKKKIDSVHSRGLAVYAAMECTIWETAWYLRDMTRLMMDMAMEDEKAVWLLDKITELACVRTSTFARLGADVIRVGDDVGMQSSLMMSEDFYRSFLKPRLARVIKAAKDIKPDIIIQYHTCGYVTPLINDFIEAGIDVLNPVQPECMSFKELHSEFGDRLSFSGTVGTQTTMPFGTPEEVKKVTLQNLEIAGEKGGLLCCPTHLLEPEVPWENIVAYAQACQEFAKGSNVFQIAKSRRVIGTNPVTKGATGVRAKRI